MRYRYYPFKAKLTTKNNRTKTIWRPVIDVIFLNGKKFVSYPVLLDTGADYNILHSEIGEMLGLKINTGKKRDLFGMGNQPIVGYEQKISFKLPGLKSTETAAIFSDELSVDSHAVLGNSGFFDKFKVTFDYKNKIIEVS